MGGFQLRSKVPEIFNKKVSLREAREIDPRSLLGLRVSKSVLFLGLLLIFLNNLNVIVPGSYFGDNNWVTLSVFSIGIFINFICIPFLYFSSLKNFKKESDFWDKEIFWILPLFFFGTFFLYSSRISTAIVLLIISIITIALIHVKFIFEAKKNFANISKGNLASRDQYLITLKYLSAYYVVLLLLLIFYNPLQQAFSWFRLNT
ncbi:MAG: hypothetical protein ACD_9C00012G0004 [uncultured bacterium]|nr:MAG: hypothetical protein ACD_9C00012G0004 [uncultured bacterium]